MENMQVLNHERLRELDTWLKTTKTKLTQVNGQRKYGGPPEVWAGPTPGARCEVFISHIPRDAYEDLLIPLFSSVGPLWEFRLMMNFSGQNRGFAYAKYASPGVATSAIQLLHGYMLEPDCRLTVRRSTEKRHLLVEDLPASTRPEKLLQVLRVLTEGVKAVSLRAGAGMEEVSAIVTFSSHHTASMAKKTLVEAIKKHFALTVSVKWLPTVKPILDELQPPLKPLVGDQKSFLPSPLEAPHPIFNSPQPTVLPPRLARLSSVPPGFCRIVGGPTAPKHPPPPSSPTTTPSQGPLRSAASAASPVMLLRMMCEVAGLGQPVYEIYYSHAGPNGFLYYTYKVCIPGITMAFTGVVMILPGPTVSSMLEEAERAVAQEVLQRLNSYQLFD